MQVNFIWHNAPNSWEQKKYLYMFQLLIEADMV